MVLVDASHPDQFIRAKERLSPADWTIMERSVRAAHADLSKEPLDWEVSRMLTRASGMLGDRPLQVLSHDPALQSPCEGADCLSPEGNAIWEGVWQELQLDLAALSTNSTHTVVLGSGHYIQAQAPDEVLTAIQRVVSDVR
jgi:hypothetical protein